MTQKWLCWICCLFCVCVAEDKIDILENIVQQQSEKLKYLENQIQELNKKEEDITQSFALADEDVLVTGYDKGFFIRQDSWEMKIKGRIFFHAFFSESNTTQNNNLQTPQARLNFNIRHEDWLVRIRPEFGQRNRIIDSYIEYKYSSFLNFRLGNAKVPFSLGRLTSRPKQIWIATTPFLRVDSISTRDVGITLFGKGLPFLISPFFQDYFTYSLGVYNGEGSLRGNVNDDFAYIGNIRFHPLTTKEKNVFIHIAGLFNDTGFRERGARIRLFGLQNHEVYARGDSGVEDPDDTNGKQLGANAGISFWYQSWKWNAEFLYFQMDRDRGGDIVQDLQPLVLWGASLGGSYRFTWEDNPLLEGIEPLAKVSFTSIEDKEGNGTANGSIGTAQDVLGQEIWEFVVGARLHFHSQVSLSFNWIMYDLKENDGFTNNESGQGDGLMHAFVTRFRFQF